MEGPQCRAGRECSRPAGTSAGTSASPNARTNASTPAVAPPLVWAPPPRCCRRDKAGLHARRSPRARGRPPSPEVPPARRPSSPARPGLRLRRPHGLVRRRVWNSEQAGRSPASQSLGFETQLRQSLRDLGRPASEPQFPRQGEHPGGGGCQCGLGPAASPGGSLEARFLPLTRTCSPATWVRARLSPKHVSVYAFKRAPLLSAKWDDFTALCTLIFHELMSDALTYNGL
ncbi:potassium/sodium hyperpolarization-activated cyclic nucleotide-gated channel 4-like [Myotis myotis]|uniref:potassium/sodium hyperpolarization-activated cyclic nucleotide-gated channel 4-like n=1 Tax=Myotis myotis TaxID=51298 RepID=UPI00174DD7F2|nr:potassium/sodium hyperpolarization-activated cyclic nucleotide-gated channel 4-like [Myotis myotis]